MNLSRMEKYHNNKNKKFKKSIAAALMGTVLVAPVALSSASVNADTVSAGSQPTQTEWVANSVSTVRAEMQAQGLNLSHVQGKYIVRKGDTLLAISQAANESMAEIAKVNHITNLNLIYVGQVLYLGSNGVVKAQSASANNEVANNTGTGVAANVMSNGGNSTGASIATPANSGIYRGFTGNGTVAAHPSRTAEQAHNAAKIALGHSGTAKTDSSAKHEAPTKTASSVKSSANAGKTTASSVKSSVASSTASSAKHSSAVSSSTPAKSSSSTVSSATSSNVASHVSSSTANKPASQAPASSASSSKAPVASSTASSQTQSSQASKPAASTTSSSASNTQNVPAEQLPNPVGPGSQSSSSTSSSVDYDKGVVNSDGTVNYQAAINQKGPWQGMDSTPNAQGQSPAEQEWLKDHPGARMAGSQFADGSENQVPVYANNPNDDIDRPALTQQQLQDANAQMQKDINAPETFGNGIQWVSSDYKGEVTGTQVQGWGTNPEQTPYEPYANTVGRVDANLVKQNYGKQPVAPTNMSSGNMKVPAGSHYVSSNITNSQGTTNSVTLTFYK
ncbi:LysM peptidoglycan-binding domain-containing protein [Ligilactobacillus aviarius]|uniref:LysM peptidoglycan-binding domain-containing protein n=1 Tax=Ligilactobacillus aviarius TaxID=1606 RepID=UPI0024BA5CB1|nr:LysM domain-containing protein [Ligilactobacillus aviarius]